MRIRYSNFHPDPSLRNTTADLKPHIAEQVIGSGLAVAFPYPTFQERLAFETKQQLAAKPPAPVQWSIDPRQNNEPYGPHFIVAETGPNGTLYYDSVPDHAPAHVKAKFDRMVAQDHVDFIERQEFLQRKNAEGSTSGYNISDVAKVLVIGKNGVKK